MSADPTGRRHYAWENTRSASRRRDSSDFQPGGVVLDIGDVRKVDAVLEVGQVSETRERGGGSAAAANVGFHGGNGDHQFAD